MLAMTALSHELLGFLTAALIFIFTALLAASKKIGVGLTVTFLIFALVSGIIIAHDDTFKYCFWDRFGHSDNQVPAADPRIQESLQRIQNDYDNLKNDIETHNKKVQTFIDQTQEWIDKDKSAQQLQDQAQEAREKKLKEEQHAAPVNQ